MRWLLLLMLLGLVGASAKNGCRIRDFYTIAYTVHNPTIRHQEMAAWLNQNVSICRSTDYVDLWNRLAEWAGTADSAQLRNLIINGYEDAIAREKK